MNGINSNGAIIKCDLNHFRNICSFKTQTEMPFNWGDQLRKYLRNIPM